MPIPPPSKIARCSTTALLLAALGGPANAAPPDEPLPPLFAKVEVTTGDEPRQTLLTGFLSGQAVADLVVVYLNDEEEPMLRMLSHRERHAGPRHAPRFLERAPSRHTAPRALD